MYRSWLALVVFLLIGLAFNSAMASISIEEHTYSPRITGSHGLLETHDGRLFISDSYMNTDSIYQIDTGTSVSVASGFNIPAGMMQADDGDIYVCDVGASRIYRFDSNWNQETWIAVPNPWNFVFDLDDLIVTSYNGNVYRVTGTVTTLLWSGLQDPFGIAIDSEGNIFVSEHTAGRIAQRSPDGTTSILTDQLSQPEGIRMGPDGWLWVADTLEGKMYRVSMEGRVEEVINSGFNFDFAVNLTQVRDDHMYLGCAGSNGRVYRLSLAEPCFHHGDVNFDSELTSSDAQVAFQIVLGSVSPTVQEECAADCNGDESVTAADAQQIFLAVLGTGNCIDQIHPPYGAVQNPHVGSHFLR